jgi:hypothetical protein
MAPSAPRRLVLAGLAIAWLVPARAHAWTEARVTTASALVAVEEDGSADVQLELGLTIDAGWLEGLEIAGLDPDLALDPAEVVVLVAESGERFTPTVRDLSGGRVSLTFARRDAPRRGHYRTRLRYRTALGERATTPTGDGTIRFEWTMPGWQSGLDGVSVQIVAPRGARLPEGEIDAHATVDVDRREAAEGTVLTFHRAHLPRTVPWVVAFEVPEEAVIPALRGPRAHAPIPAPPAPTAPAPTLPRALFVLVALFVTFAVGKRVTFERAARARGAVPRPLVPARPPLHALFCAGAGAASLELARRGFELWPAPLFAIVLSSIQRPVRMISAPRLGAFRVATRAHLKDATRARRLATISPTRWLDASRPLGAASTIAAALGVWLMARSEGPWPFAFTAAHGATLLVCLLLTSPATRLPTPPRLRLAALARLAHALRAPLRADAPPFALCLLVHEDADGQVQDARLRVATPSRPQGLIRLDVAWLERDGLGGHRASPALVVVTRAGSPAELAIAGALPALRAQQAPAGRRARVADLVELPRVLGALGEAEPAAPARDDEPRPRAAALATIVTQARATLA